MKTITLALLVALTLSTPAVAEQAGRAVTGNDWVESCDSSKTSDQSFCSGYVLGFIDAIGSWRILSNSPITLCIPAEVTVGQMRDVATRYIADNIKFRHLDAARLFAEAFLTAWPCKKR